MSPTLQALGIDKLTVDERLSLLDEIWDSVAEDEADLPIPDWHKSELQRRLDAFQANPKAGSTWEEVKARLLDKK